ncbi:MAG: ABC transporter permease, partial [Ornithinibacter sp.]
MADGSRGRALGRRRPSSALLGVVPFFAYTTVFLLIPTLVVLLGAFLDGSGGFTLANVQALTSPAVLRALRNSVVLSAVTAFAGAVIGGILAYAVST